MADKVRVTLSNPGGELCHKIVDADPSGAITPIKDALMRMLVGIDLYPGDTVTVRYEEDART